MTSSVAFDIGAGFTKYRSAGKNGSFPSIISVEDQTAAGFEAAGLVSNHDLVIGFNDRNWAIGESVYTHGLMPQKNTHRSRVQTDFYRVLIAAALISSIQQSATICPIVSLPPAMYWDKEKQKEIIAGEYVVGHLGRTLRYTIPRENISVIPEAFGSAALFCLTGKGQPAESNLFEITAGIIDIGTYTTDFLQLHKMKPVRRGTDSLPHALSDIHALLRAHTSSRGVDLDIYEADTVLQRGWFLRNGKREYFQPETDQWFSELAQTIAGHIRSIWSGGDAVEAILIAGGGSPYVGKYLEMEFEHSRTFDSHGVGVDSWMGNVEGAFRYLMFQHALRK